MLRPLLMSVMSLDTLPSAYLAPLQEVMLRDSLGEPDAGHHVEQVEMTFTEDLATDTVVRAWRETVIATEALRTAFEFEGEIPLGLRTVAHFPETQVRDALPDCWGSWLAVDRCQPLLVAGEVPWRTAFWPAERRLVWTFHHALLDGRSITRILDGFLATLAGNPMTPLARSRWNVPSSGEIATASRIFCEKYRDSVPARLGESQAGNLLTEAIFKLGNTVLRKLESRAVSEKSTVATFVTWAWGQALACTSNVPTVLIEQIRAGAPQPGTAGFTMNLLPLRTHRHRSGSPTVALRAFRDELLEMREIESVSFADFPNGIYPNLNTPGLSTLMVIEVGTGLSPRSPLRTGRADLPHPALQSVVCSVTEARNFCFSGV